MLSVVVPIYNEEENVTRFHAALEVALDNTGLTWEVVYVNDGSRDSSLLLLMELQRRDPRVTVVELSRNFGHQAALTAGLNVARGDAVVLMDGDFQDPPEVVPRMVRAWENGAKVIIAERTSRAEKGIRGKLFPLFYKIMRWVSDFPIPLNAGIFGLLDRQVVDTINCLQEGNRYLPGIRAWVGFPTAFVTYDRADRAAGEPKQTFIRLFKYAMDAIFSFSYKPLRLGLALGGLAIGLSLLLMLGSLLHAFFGTSIFLAFELNTVAILFIGGVQLLCIGLLGEYIGRIYDEVRRRPLYIVHKVHNRTTAQAAEVHGVQSSVA
ncbi:MAG TPA: glycosyltransferase family 2 protein [Candidatus Angelobacter sp.]|jgi:glycosyltransferase involved in cell wall biosynthesis|nr:glycosyltransferase family 2 protein [Candidatus Angelobacter sp.]